MSTFFINDALAVVHLRRMGEVTDGPIYELALTADGVVWSRHIPVSIVGPQPDPAPWTVNKRIPKTQVLDWIVARLAEGWWRVGD